MNNAKLHEFKTHKDLNQEERDELMYAEMRLNIGDKPYTPFESYIGKLEKEDYENAPVFSHYDPDALRSDNDFIYNNIWNI